MDEPLFAVRVSNERKMIGAESVQFEVVSHGLQYSVESALAQYLQVVIVRRLVRGRRPMHIGLPVRFGTLDHPIVSVIVVVVVATNNIATIVPALNSTARSPPAGRDRPSTTNWRYISVIPMRSA